MSARDDSGRPRRSRERDGSGATRDPRRDGDAGGRREDAPRAAGEDPVSARRPARRRAAEPPSRRGDGQSGPARDEGRPRPRSTRRGEDRQGRRETHDVRESAESRPEQPEERKASRSSSSLDQAKALALDILRSTRRPSSAARAPRPAADGSDGGSAASLWSRLRGLTRAQFLQAGFGVAFGVVAVRLAWLQTVRSGAYASAAKEERTARITLPHKRGAIYDRNGVVLAQSVDAVTVYTIPQNVATEQIAPIAALLARHLGGSASDYAGKMTGTGTFAYIQRQADPTAVDELKADLKAQQLSGIYYIDDSRRVYPMGTVGGNLVGCVGTDGNGLTGLELYYDDLLTGTDGYLIQERSLYGSPVAGGQDERQDPVDGTNIVISIDVDIQQKAEETLVATKAEWNCGDAVCVVMQPETGEVLACASTPLLDPGDLSGASADALKLRAITDSYEPGSTTKPVTASMAIDLGLATPDTTYPAPAKIQVGDDWVSDADARNVFIDMSLTNMLERSSNVGAVLCAESVGADQFSKYLAKYHIGSKTGIDYPGEAPGIVPELKNYTGAWMAMAFGQSFAVPPIQMVRALGTIANEGVSPSPHFLLSKGGEEVTYPEGDRVIATATAEQVCWMMNSVVEYGYAYTGAIPGYHLSAKTGTSERLDPKTGTYAKNSFTVSFAGFGPTEDPKALVYILFDEVDMEHESSSAGAPWAAIMEEALTKLGIQPYVDPATQNTGVSHV